MAEEVKKDNCVDLYELHCKQEFTDLKEDITAIKRAVIGNGDVGLMIKVDRNTRWITLMNWFYGAIFTVVGLGILTAWLCSRLPK